MKPDSRAAIARTMTETDLKGAVLDAAALYGWLVHHDRPARVKDDDGGDTYRTAVEGDTGFPDLVLAHPRYGVLFVELKSERGTLSAEQTVWLEALTNGGAHAEVWRPADWVDGRIDRLLKGNRRKGPMPVRPGEIAITLQPGPTYEQGFSEGLAAGRAGR